MPFCCMIAWSATRGCIVKMLNDALWATEAQFGLKCLKCARDKQGCQRRDWKLMIQLFGIFCLSNTYLQRVLSVKGQSLHQKWLLVIELMDPIDDLNRYFKIFNRAFSLRYGNPDRQNFGTLKNKIWIDGCSGFLSYGVRLHILGFHLLLNCQTVHIKGICKRSS